MKMVLATMLTIGGLIASCGAQASSLAEIEGNARVLKAYEVSIENVEIKKFAIDPLTTGVATEITLNYARPCYSKDEFFSYSTTELANGSLHLYVLNLQSERALDELRCMGLYLEKKTVKVPGIFQLEDIQVINLGFNDIEMPAQFDGVYTVDLNIRRSQITKSGTILRGTTTVGCVDKLAGVAHKSLENGLGYDLFLAPIVLKHQHADRIRCVAPNIERFSILVSDVYANLEDFTPHYLK